MSFLAPIFLLGTLAIALPVIFHLIRRSTKEKLPFSSLLFLSPTPPRLTRRSRLEHLLLLALRCGIICLLAFAFARPFFKDVAPTPPTQPGKRIIVLLDMSASMRRADLWPQATSKALNIASQAGVADSLSIVAFDRESRTLLSFEEWAAAAPEERRALVQGRLKGVSPSWFSTRLGQALIVAADAASDKGTNTSAPAEIVVISDLQEGSRPEPVQGYEWPKNLYVSLQPLKLPTRGNASMQLVRPSEADTRANQPVRVRVTNSGDSKKEQFKLTWQGGNNTAPAAPPLEVYVPAGQSRVFVMPDLGTNQPGADRVVLTGDDEDFDNMLFIASTEPKVIEVAYVGDETEQNPKQQFYFLKRAFQETHRQTVRVSMYSPGATVPANDKLNLIVTPGPLSDALARQLREQLARGKVVLYTMLPGISDTELASLLRVPELRVSEAPRDTHAILAAIDFEHPLFAPFSDPRFSDFSKIHFWRHRTVDPASLDGARVLAKFDNSDPALIEVPAGKGRLFLLTSGWTPEDSQLALSTKFVPLLYSLLEQGGESSPVDSIYQVGDALPLGASSRETASMRTPAGAVVPLAGGETRFTETVTPGIYVAQLAKEHHPFAVNLDPLESRVTPLKSDTMEALGTPLAGGQAVASAELRRHLKLRHAELENRQKIWRWVILAALVAALVETWLSFWTSRQADQTRRGDLEVKYGA
jgi:hypothetical protein